VIPRRVLGTDEGFSAAQYLAPSEEAQHVEAQVNAKAGTATVPAHIVVDAAQGTEGCSMVATTWA